MDLDGSPPRRHPFGTVGNALVHAGASLAMIQAGVFVAWWATAPIRGDVPLTGFALLAYLVGVVGIGYVGGWLPYRALRSWRARSPRVLGRLVVPGLALMPLGLVLLQFGAPLFSLAGLLLSLGALTARDRVIAAGRDGQNEPGP